MMAPRAKTSTDFDFAATQIIPARVSAPSQRREHLYVFGVVTYETFGAAHKTTFYFIPDVGDVRKSQICEKWNSAE